MSAVLAETPATIRLELPATTHRPCVLHIDLSFQRARNGGIERHFLASLSSPRTPKKSGRVLCMAVDCEQRSYLDLRYDPYLWICSTRIEIDADEAKRIEDAFAPHLTVERKGTAS